MNDPNGLVQVGDTWHLFFQHNPNGTEWGDISWGHATSHDLLTWYEHPIAIPFNDQEFVFSGSAVVDSANSSGFGAADHPPVVAVYTSAFREHPQFGNRQAQSLAVSTDDGFTWSRHHANPVNDRMRDDYRDPKVFWFDDPGADGGTGHWVMVAVEADASRVIISRSNDLRGWRETSIFESDRLPSFWECPDLYPLALDGDPNHIRWVLHLSARAADQAYLVGDFDGERFVPNDESAGLLDAGHDVYAAATFNDSDRRILIGWMGHAFRAPTQGWHGMMTTPRELRLATTGGAPRVHNAFVAELDRYEQATSELAELALSDRTERIADPKTIAQRIRLKLHPADAAECGVVVRAGDSEGTRIGWDARRSALFIDRTRSGAIPDSLLLDRTWVTPPLACDCIDLDIVVDAMSVEVLAFDGAVAIGELIFPSDTATRVDAFAEGGTAVLRSIRVAALTRGPGTGDG